MTTPWPPPGWTVLSALDAFEHVVRDYDYTTALGDGTKGHEMRSQRLDEIAAAKEWVRQQITQPTQGRE